MVKLIDPSFTLQIFRSKEEGNAEGDKKKSRGDQTKELLAKYGGAYLATSITLSLISFSLCYVLIAAGVDVQALLQKVTTTTKESLSSCLIVLQISAFRLTTLFGNWNLIGGHLN